MKINQCPSCSGVMEKTALAENLTGKVCADCHGVNITLGDYLHYLAKSPSIDEDLLTATDDVVMDADTKNALVCSCGKIMNKYRISPESDRKLDYCISCQSIWMDGGEWEYLKSHKMHYSINKIFTDEWQRNIRHENTKQNLRQHYEQQLGEQDYKKIKEIREWLVASPNRRALISYLNADDPYSAEK